MSTEAIYPHIFEKKGQSACLRRTPRVRVAQVVMDYLAYGWSAEEMCRQHPYLTPAEVHAVMAYYFDHQREIDAEIKADWSEAEETRAKAPSTTIELPLRARGLL